MKGLILALVVVASVFGSPLAVTARTLLPGDTCLTRGSLHTVGTGALECGPKLRWRMVAEGRPCLKVAARTSTLSCINRREGRRWQKPFTYQEQACDPNDPRLSNIKLPPEEFLEGRIAAACVALAWLNNKDAKLPEVEIFVPDYVSSAARRSIEQSAKWQLRVIWEHRTYADVTPTVFMFDSKRFLCSKDHIALATNFFVYRDCVDLKHEWTCLNGTNTAGLPNAGPNTALAATPSYWSGDKLRAGVISYTCEFGETSTVVPFKFYAGLLYCDTTGGAAAPLCALLSKGAMYIYGTYIHELGEAESTGRAANLDTCAQSGGWPTTCPTSPSLFRKYISSSQWLTTYDTYCNHGSDLYGEGGDCSPAEHLGYTVNGLAFEWVTAHYGIDAAYGLINATRAAGRSKTKYLRIMAGYLGLSNDKFFAAIDAYVVARLGDRIR